MKRLIIFLLLFAAIKVAGQTTGYLRFDTVRIFKQNGTCELYLINSTKDSLGQLTNIGGGLTRFIKPRVLNDSTFVVGLDTLTIRGTGGSGSGTNNANIGSAFRWLLPGTQEIKTVANSNTIAWDSTSNANSLTGKVDTSVIATQYDLTQLGSGDTTYTEKPIYVKTGSNDTLALAYGYGLTTRASDTALIVDTFSISTRAWRQKGIDSVVGLINGLPTPTLQQVLNSGRSGDSAAIQNLNVTEDLYAPIRAASDTVAALVRRGDIWFDTTTNSMMYRDNNYFTYFASLSNSLLPNRPNMRLISVILRPVVSGGTVTWSALVDAEHDSLGVGTISCSGGTIVVPLQPSPAAKIHTILIAPDESLMGIIDAGISFQPTQALISLRRRLGTHNARLQGNGTTYAATGDVTFSYTAATGNLLIDWISAFTPASSGTAVKYVGSNGYNLELQTSGLSGNDRRYIVKDAFGNTVTDNPTTSDLIEIVTADWKYASIDACVAGGDGFAAATFTAFSNFWLIGLVEY
jgi:hypothetical protein